MYTLYIHTHSDDIYAEDSIELLKSSGIDFEKFEKEGKFCYSVFCFIVLYTAFYIFDV